jgi:hypothetical protein
MSGLRSDAQDGRLADRSDMAQHTPMLYRGHPGNVSVRWNGLNHDGAQ